MGGFCVGSLSGHSGLVLGLDRSLLALQVSVGAGPFDRLVSLFSHINLYFAVVIRFCVVTMVIRPSRFNIYLLCAATLLSVTGCQSTKTKEEKQTATLRVHQETNPLPLDQSERVTVLRHAPMYIEIERSPFLSEAQVASARVVDNQDGFALQIQFNQQGQWLLEQYSSANTKRRFAIRSQFRVSTNVFDRWLAAPVIGRRIVDGVLVFTPDTDRTEAEAIARGLNNVANYVDPKKKAESKTKFSDVP